MLFFDFTSPQTLKYGSMSAVFGFLKYKNYSFVGSKKFLPPNLFIRGSVNLQEGWRLSKMNTNPYE
jgi:hypothetical protein